MSSTLLLFFAAFGLQLVAAQRDCRAFVGHNITSMTEALGSDPGCSGSFTSVYGNGTIQVFSMDQQLSLVGNYTIDNTDNDEECYMHSDWTTGDTECITWSPTADLHSLVGCFVFNAPCVRQCTPRSMNTGWFAGLILNALPTPTTTK